MSSIRVPIPIKAASGNLDYVAPHKEDRAFVTALARGLEVLRCFSEQAPELTVSEIAALTGLAQPTAWRLCHTLRTLGYLVQVAGSERLTVATPILSLGHSALAPTSLEHVLRPHLMQLAQRYRAAVGLADYDRGHMIYLLSARAGPLLDLTSLRVGTRVPLEKTAIGWAFAASLGTEARARVLTEMRKRLGPAWAANEKHLASARAELAEHGFIVRCGLLALNLNVAAAPVRLASGKILAVNCSAPDSVLPRERLYDEVGPAIVKLADKMGTLLTDHVAPIIV